MQTYWVETRSYFELPNEEQKARQVRQKRSLSHNIPFRVLELGRGKKIPAFPTQKLSRSRFLLSLVPLFGRNLPQKSEKFESPLPAGALVSCDGVSGSGGCCFCLLALAACVLCDAGHFALVSAAPFLEICVSRSAVA